tara:strand:- start:3256 stop:4341 length:1086 start_codon:yes stop_codon:yes gene_type:complete
MLKKLQGHIGNLATGFLGNILNTAMTNAQSSAMDSGKMASQLRSKSPFEIPDAPNEYVNRNPLSFNYVQYPLDLGNEELGHYILFKSGYHDFQEEVQSFIKKVDDTAGDNLSGISNPKFRAAALNSNNRGKITSKIPAKSRLNSAVALYLPANVQTSYKQSYEQDEGGLSADIEAGVKSVMAADSAGDKLKATIDGMIGPGAKRAKQALGEFASVAGLGDPFRLGMKRAGLAMNPRNEQFYNTPEMRNFTFTFDFWPRDPDEAKAVNDIIQIFKYNSAPGLNFNGSIFTIPNYFEIQYMRAGEENPNLHKFASLYCTGVDINYAPDGQPSFLKDGQPVHTQMTVSFVEDHILTKGDILQGL